ncbi:hypothetical protein C2845_PM02G22380 [Panicum miliaceum]|uniref:Uncharacterized protein n=1 Tax=Panicum miliaceum TaxID=4540 RepID=A0A3L6SAX0_PANMI|nr:hypothetical protein C2845_PM02G22380 [Panicum miliaceum]
MVVRSPGDLLLLIAASAIRRDGRSMVRILFLRGVSGEIFFVARPVRLVYSFRFAVGWEFFCSRSTSSVKTMADRVTGRLSSMRSIRVVAVSFFPCHQRSGSTDDRSAVSVGLLRGSVALALAAVSKVRSCVPAVVGGPWPGASPPLHVGVCGRGDGQRCLPEMVTTGLLCACYVIPVKLRGFLVKRVCTVRDCAI